MSRYTHLVEALDEELKRRARSALRMTDEELARRLKEIETQANVKGMVEEAQGYLTDPPEEPPTGDIGALILLVFRGMKYNYESFRTLRTVAGSILTRLGRAEAVIVLMVTAAYFAQAPWPVVPDREKYPPLGLEAFLRLAMVVMFSTGTAAEDNEVQTLPEEILQALPPELRGLFTRRAE